jgi:signal transduction histidine kinase
MNEQKNKPKKLFLKSKKKEESDIIEKWNILIVDDEKDIHVITRNALDTFVYNNKKLNFISCYSAKQAEELLRSRSDISVILLDVVMEHKSAGLDLVNIIRRLLGNDTVQIILRTGHPGEVPEKEVIEEYEINDYKTKTELTQNKLLTSIRTGLRTYEALINIKMANEELQGLDIAKNNFLKLISHEIRTPLNGIMGPIEILKDSSSDNPDFNVFFDVLRVSVDRLFKLSETALIITELQIRKELSKEKVLVTELVNESIDNNKLAIEEKGVHINSKEVGIDVSIMADKKLMIRTITSIIDNAVKYSENEREIRINTVEEEGRTLLKCFDRGRGFSQESLKNLFKPFCIGEQHYDSNCGLDLKVAKQIMDVHSGDILIENQESGGACVSLVF